MRAHEFMNEKINPDVVKNGFRDSKIIGDGKYEISGEGQNFSAEDRNFNILNVRIIDRQTKEQVAFAMFTVRYRPEDNEPYLTSMSTHVMEKYRGRGLARLMYQYANNLGNDVMPSGIQTQMGRDMWKGLAKHIKQAPPLPEPKPPEVKKSKWYDRWKKYLLRPAT